METRVPGRSRRAPKYFVAGCIDGLNSIATEDPRSVHYFAYSSHEARGRKKSNKTTAQSEASKENRRSDRLRARSTSASSTNSQPPNIFTVNDKIRKKYKTSRPRAEKSTTESHGDQIGLVTERKFEKKNQKEMLHSRLPKEMNPDILRATSVQRSSPEKMSLSSTGEHIPTNGHSSATIAK